MMATDSTTARIMLRVSTGLGSRLSIAVCGVPVDTIHMGDRIMAGGAPRLAATDPLQGKPGAAQCAVAAHRLQGVFGASRRVTANPRQNWRDEQLIKADQCPEDEG